MSYLLSEVFLFWNMLQDSIDNVSSVRVVSVIVRILWMAAQSQTRCFESVGKIDCTV